MRANNKTFILKENVFSFSFNCIYFKQLSVCGSDDAVRHTAMLAILVWR